MVSKHYFFTLFPLLSSSSYLGLAECKTMTDHKKCELLQDLLVGSIISAFKSETKFLFFLMQMRPTSAKKYVYIVVQQLYQKREVIYKWANFVRMEFFHL